MSAEQEVTPEVTPEVPSSADNVTWVVNDLGELGVEVNGRCFFLYKGRSLEYIDGKHDDGTPILYRRVGKREFGETQWPLKWIINGRADYPYKEEVVYTAGVSYGPPDNPEYQWRALVPLRQK